VFDMQEVIGMQFCRFSIAINRVLSVPVSEVGVVRSLLVLPGLLVFRRLFVMVGEQRSGKPFPTSLTWSSPLLDPGNFLGAAMTLPEQGWKWLM
jgi:hypothetical protein